MVSLPAKREDPLKALGLSFGRAFLRAFKVALLYSVDHSASQNALQQAYDSLSLLLKQSSPFTFGFMNQRVLVNNILTSDSTLASLEADFSKRSLAAITFTAVVTFGEFKRLLALLTAKPEIIEQNGGIKALLERNPIEGVRVLPGKKGGGQTEDTVLQMDTESYLMAQAVLEPGPAIGAPGLPNLELLLKSAGMEQPSGFTGNPDELLGVAEKATQAVLTDPQRNPTGFVAVLAHVLGEVSPDLLISAFPSDKPGGLHGRAPAELAVEIVEDVAVRWSAGQLSEAAGQSDVMGREADIAQVLARVIKTTKTAERLLQKFARFVEEANLPPEVYERIRRELTWVMLSPQDKQNQLLSLKQFNTEDFRHLLSYVAEMLSAGRPAEAIQVAGHYWESLNLDPPMVRAEELIKLPELLHAMNSPQTLEFMRKVIERLRKELLEGPDAEWEYHSRIALCLASGAQEVAIYEDFECVRLIGLDLQRSLARDRTQHQECCAKSLRGLITPRSVEQLIELYLQKSGETGWLKIVVSLLKWVGPQGAELVFHRLEEEDSAPNRLRLIRMLAQLGSHAIAPARKRLTDERWYVVRNACYLLGSIGDPELARQLAPVLSHPDARVQQAAFTAIIMAHPPDRGPILANSLPSLYAHLQDAALDELILLRDPATSQGLEEFVHQGKGVKTGTLLKVVQVLSVLPSEASVDTLGRLLSDMSQTHQVRRAALVSLSRSPFPRAQRLLAEFANLNPADPLAAECQRLSAPVFESRYAWD
ncbi:MAG: HEAT repeat domain-containing protein [Acidobacteria bacterium]|nr:HEAT repeat domain-containing protein [Acidobacteriota bacterium]